MSIIDSKQACFYHPTKVIFLDDNKGFLEAMEMEFSEQYNMMTFTDPNEALLTINNSKEDLLVNAVGLHEEKCSDDSHYTDGINISHLINMTYDRSRFDNVAVLVIDYDMPEINGIDFCNNLGDRHLFKILLTAEAGKDIAINAFNSGVIDKFILKTNQNLHQELSSAINDLTNKYFKGLSKVVLENCGHELNSLLNNRAYIDLFKSIVHENKAVEFYLIDKIGSFLFLTKNATPVWFILCDKRKIQEHVDLLRGYGFSEKIIRKISDRENILFLFSENECKEEISSWGKYLFQSNVLDSHYSYSIINGAVTNSICWEKVLPYETLSPE